MVTVKRRSSFSSLSLSSLLLSSSSLSSLSLVNVLFDHLFVIKGNGCPRLGCDCYVREVKVETTVVTVNQSPSAIVVVVPVVVIVVVVVVKRRQFKNRKFRNLRKFLS